MMYFLGACFIALIVWLAVGDWDYPLNDYREHYDYKFSRYK